MSDTREGFAEAAETFANFAKEAVYVAIGVGVLEFQKAQVRRQELASARKQELACARKAVNKRAKDFDARARPGDQGRRLNPRAGAGTAPRTGTGHRPPGP